MATLGACANGVKEAREALPRRRHEDVTMSELFADFPADAILLPFNACSGLVMWPPCRLAIARSS